MSRRRREPNFRSLLEALVAELPEETLVLRELAARAQESLVDMLSKQVGTEPELLSLLASALNDLANRLSDLGRHEPALVAAEQAVARYRELAEQRPDAFRPALAGSLGTLANSRSALAKGRSALRQRRLALAAAYQATAHYRVLDAQRPGAFRPGLAASLGILAATLSDLARHERALSVAEQAAALYRELAARWPDAFRPGLAASLNNLTATLTILGQHEPALSVAEQAVAIRRELAARSPDAFWPVLACSLAIQANCLRGLNRVVDALTASREAVAKLAPAFVSSLPHLTTGCVRYLRNTCNCARALVLNGLPTRSWYA